VISMTISSTTNQADEGMHLGVLEKWESMRLPMEVTPFGNNWFVKHYHIITCVDCVWSCMERNPDNRVCCITICSALCPFSTEINTLRHWCQRGLDSISINFRRAKATNALDSWSTYNITERHLLRFFKTEEFLAHER
jgi:hypothetical protein